MTKAEKKWRTRYSKASSRLRSQIRALEKKYPESVALERGGIEDWGCTRFLLHNGKKPEDFEFISLDAFRSMMESLGYRRRSND